jgi:hypothetical protein
VSSVSAWGDIGHAVVCEIAFGELNEKARREVIRLIRQDEEYRYFADSCIWPDHPKSRDAEHFVNVSRNTATIAGEQCPVAPVCLFTAIATDLQVLKTSPDDAKRLESLKYLGHWLGDLHQPLHISFADDRGGGKIREIGPCLFNLHSVWDTCIIEQRLGADARKIALALVEEITDAERTAWRGGTLATWANESYQIARRVSVGYCVRVGAQCNYSTGHVTFAPGHEKAVKVNAKYLDAHMFIVAERLKQAGVRLGHLLNQVLGQ